MTFIKAFIFDYMSVFSWSKLFNILELFKSINTLVGLWFLLFCSKLILSTSLKTFMTWPLLT